MILREKKHLQFRSFGPRIRHYSTCQSYSELAPTMTIKASDFSTTTIRVVAYTPDRSALTPSMVLATIMSKFSDRLGGDVQVLPIPADIPDEIPRLELKSEDRRWSFQWSPGRSSAMWSSQETLGAAAADDVNVSECAKILIHLFQQKLVEVNRLAYVIHRVAEIDSPAPALVAHFCTTESCDLSNVRAPLRNSKAFQLHNLKQYDSGMDGVRLNSWVRCKAENSADATSPGKLLVEQDLNTPSGDIGRRFTPEQIGDFYLMVTREANQIVALYFPD